MWLSQLSYVIIIPVTNLRSRFGNFFAELFSYARRVAMPFLHVSPPGYTTLLSRCVGVINNTTSITWFDRSPLECKCSC